MKMSTMSNPLTTQSVERKQKDGSKVMVPCPDAVVVYNKFMGGVDKGDQLQHYYRIRTKCVKNYKQIFWFTNAHILSHFSPVTTSERSLKPSASHLPNSRFGVTVAARDQGAQVS